MLLPSRYTIGSACLLALLGLPALWLEGLFFWWLFCGAILLILLVDAILVLSLPRLEVERDLPRRFALDSFQKVRLRLRNHSEHAWQVELLEELPTAAQSEELPWQGKLEPMRESTLEYNLSFQERGELGLGLTWILVRSPLRFWQRRRKLGSPSLARVYPNYAPVLRLALLALENRSDPSGQLLRKMLGVSKEFHQLRDFREGDSLAQVDWKATSRRRKLISRDYQEQRDQTILFLLDSGRRMRAQDGELSQFDHALNAVLLVSWLALREGDQVGILSFGEGMSWQAPLKGPHSMPQMLEYLYDLKTSLVPSDYREASEELMRQQKKRAMVILLSNLRGEQAEEVGASLQLLAQKHFVLATSLRENQVQDALTKPVQEFEGSLAAAAAAQYLEQKEQNLAQLREQGIRTLETPAQDLPIALAQSYLEAKDRSLI